MNKSELRKIKYEKAKKRKKTIRIFFIFLILTLVIFFALLKLGIFNVKNIKITGITKVTSEEVKKRSGIKIGENYLTISKKNRIRDINSIPMVKSSTVSFSLGGTVDINIVERTPVAQIVNYTDYYLIDNELKIVDLKNEPMQNIPEVTGVSGESLKLGNIILEKKENESKFMKSLFADKNVFEKIKTIDLNDKTVEFSTKENTLIDFGSYSNVDYKFEMLDKIFADMDENKKNYSIIYMEKGDDPIAVENADYSESDNENLKNDNNNDLEISTELN